MKTTTRALLPVLTFGMALTLGACGKGGGGSTPIQAAQPTEQAQKLLKCADAKLTGQAKTFQGADGKVCRLRDGKKQDETIPVLFAASKLDKRVGVYQTVAITVTARNADGSLRAADTETAEQAKLAERNHQIDQNDVVQFLRRTCRPIAKRVFSRSELAGTVLFRSKKREDILALPTAPGSTAVSDISDEEPFGDDASPVRSRRKTKKDGEKEPVTRQVRQEVVVAAPAEYHAEFGFDMVGEGPDRQIKLSDEVEGVLSGSIIVLVKPTDDQVRFCNQLVMRIGENFGLIKGRDCAGRDSTATAAPVDKKSPAATGLMKAGNSLNLDSVKVSQDEIFEIVKPVCGSI